MKDSRITKALTEKTICYESHLRRFWKSVRYEEDEKIIYSAVRLKDEKNKDLDVEIKFTVADVRRNLDLKDNDDDPIIPKRLRKGFSFRMGYEGHVNYKVHCVVHAFSHRKGACDETSDYIMNIITCLVLNRRYNISQVLFSHMVDNVKGEKYIMYPRFIQMILNDLVPNLSKDPADELKVHHMNTETFNRLNKYKGLTADQEPRVKRMFGKITNSNYVAPKNDAWRDENSNSEDETDSLRGMHEKKLRFWFVKDGKRKRTPKVSPKVETSKIVIKEPAKKKSPPRLVDEPVIDPTELVKQGADLLNMTFDKYIKHIADEAAKAAAKVQSSHVEKVAETSVKNVEAESVKEKEAEGVAETYSSATESDTKPEFDTSKLGVVKIKLKVKPRKKKTDSDEEDSTYIPTPKEKKKLRRKHKAHPSGFIPRNVRARKGAATMPEIQSAPESPIYEKVEKNDEAEKDDDEVEYMGERESTPPPPPPVNPTIHIPDDPQEPSSAKKDNNSRPVSLDDVGDLFNGGKINLLTKRVSILEKAKKKAEVERDELKEKLKKVLSENNELKLAVNDHAERIDELMDDLGEQAKVIDQLTTECAELNVKYESMNEVNKTLHQMIGELHESSSNENKVLRQEIEALRADKVVKDEQLNMLYTMMEHKLGINVQAMYNDLEFQRVKERRVQREKELAGEATQKKKGLVVDHEEILGSSSQQVQPDPEVKVDQRKRKVRKSQGAHVENDSDTKLLRYKEEKDGYEEKEEEEEEEKLDDEELMELFDDIDNYDPGNDNDNDNDDDQGATGLLVVKPNVQQTLDDFLNDKLNEQVEDQHQESSSSGKQHVDQVFLTQPKVIYLHSSFKGELEVPRMREEMLEELGMDDGNLKFDIEDDIVTPPKIHPRSTTAWERDMTRIKPSIILNIA
ncbi:hypothetical protein Hanom_Chr17g01587171 [Helianthus anomalus]